MDVFDEAKKTSQREGAFFADPDGDFEYLREEVASRLADRLLDIYREFPDVIDVGAGKAHMASHVVRRPGTATLRQFEFSDALADVARDAVGRLDTGSVEVTTHTCDQGSLPLPAESTDLALSCMSLHWQNDLPGMLAHVRRTLRPDGAFVGAMLGGDTLRELRGALALAEQERFGGVAPHASPFAQVSDIGDVLGRAGFTLTTVDTDMVELRFADAFSVMRHLQGMGEGHAAHQRRRYTDPGTFAAAAAIYESVYGRDGYVPATFQVIYMIGWAPAPTQPKPKERGSAQKSMKEFGHTTSDSTWGDGKL